MQKINLPIGKIWMDGRNGNLQLRRQSTESWSQINSFLWISKVQNGHNDIWAGFFDFPFEH